MILKPFSFKKYSFPLLSSIVLTVIPLVFTSILSIIVLQHQAEIEQFSFWEWFALTVVCCFTSVFALTPPTVLALIAGYFLGWDATLPIFLINMVAIYLINVIVSRLDRDKLVPYLSENPKVKNILDNLLKEELKLIFYAKLSPILPFSLINLALSLSGAKLKNILLGGFLGMVPRTLLAIWTGKQAKEIKNLLENPNEENVNKIILILLVLISIFGIFGIVKRLIPSQNKLG